MRLIKRYSNRKLYDTKSKKYITLDGIADLVREGEEVQVIHNDTDEDLTKLTLSQIVYEREKKKDSLLPKSMLTNLIRNNSMVGRFKKTVNTFAELMLPQDLDENVEQMISEGQLSENDGVELRGMLLKLWNKNLERVNYLVEARIQTIFDTFNVPTKLDLVNIENLINKLDAKVDRLLLNQERLESQLLQKENFDKTENTNSKNSDKNDSQENYLSSDSNLIS